MKAKISIVLTSLMTLFFNFTYSFASTIESVLGDEAGNPREIDGNFAGNLIGVFRWIGYAIAVGMLIFIGIKYVMASADEKADLKKSLVKYVIGAILIIGAVSIANMIFNAG